MPRSRNSGQGAGGGTPNVGKKNNVPNAERPADKPARSEPAVAAGNAARDVGTAHT